MLFDLLARLMHAGTIMCGEGGIALSLESPNLSFQGGFIFGKLLPGRFRGRFEINAKAGGQGD